MGKRKSKFGQGLSMTQLAGSPPPGVQPDNVEAPIQELEVRDVVICGSVVSG